MGGVKASGDMRYFQILISYEHAKHLPGNVITDYFNKLELVTGTGVIDSIPNCIVKVEHDGIDINQIKDETHQYRDDSINFFTYNVIPGTTSAAAVKTNGRQRCVVFNSSHSVCIFSNGFGTRSSFL